MAEWHYSKEGNQHGPISTEELKQLANTNQLTATDLVWREGMADWKPASKVKGLCQEQASNVPPPIPSVSGSTASATVKSKLAGLNIDWNYWNSGGWILFVSACLGIISMLLKWVDIGLVSANGFSQGTFLFLGVFVYPVFRLLSKKSIHQYGGIACGVIGIILAYHYVSTKNVSLLGQQLIAAGYGAYVFGLASVGIIVGTIMYEPADDSVEL